MIKYYIYMKKRFRFSTEQKIILEKNFLQNKISDHDITEMANSMNVPRDKIVTRIRNLKKRPDEYLSLEELEEKIISGTMLNEKSKHLTNEQKKILEESKHLELKELAKMINANEHVIKRWLERRHNNVGI